MNISIKGIHCSEFENLTSNSILMHVATMMVNLIYSREGWLGDEGNNKQGASLHSFS